MKLIELQLEIMLYSDDSLEPSMIPNYWTWGDRLIEEELIAIERSDIIFTSSNLENIVFYILDIFRSR